jgi:carbonic anhydrase
MLALVISHTYPKTERITRVPAPHFQNYVDNMTHKFVRLLPARSSLITALFLITAGQISKSADATLEDKSTSPAAASPRVQTKESQAAMTPAAALEELRAGNARFVAGQSKVRNLPAKVRATAAGQYPFGVIVSCLDSRTPVELVFDQGIGDLFNARVAGNVLNDDILGSLEFACKVSGSKLILVLGHSNCGAIKGAVDNVELGNLTGLLHKIKPAVAKVPEDVQPRTSKNAAFVQKVAESNVHLVMQQIREQSPILREMLDHGQIALAGGMYDLETGQVHFISN